MQSSQMQTVRNNIYELGKGEERRKEKGLWKVSPASKRSLGRRSWTFVPSRREVVMDRKYFCETCCLVMQGYAMSLSEITIHLSSHPTHMMAVDENEEEELDPKNLVDN